jgi:hypothetical protein
VGITGAGSFTRALPTASSEANSLGVRLSISIAVTRSIAVIRVCPNPAISNVQFCSDRRITWEGTRRQAEPDFNTFIPPPDILNWNHTHLELLPFQEGFWMMIFMEKIEPPPIIPLTDDERAKLNLEAIESENRWVKNFIDRLAGVVRDPKN